MDKEYLAQLSDELESFVKGGVAEGGDGVLVGFDVPVQCDKLQIYDENKTVTLLG